MALTIRLRTAVLAAALAIALGCGSGSSPSAPSSSGTSGGSSSPGPGATPTTSDLQVTSRSGDWIGNGQQVHLTAADARFRVQQIPSQGAFQIFIDSVDGKTWWRVDIGAPAGQSLQASAYENAERYTAAPGALPRLSVSADGRGCTGEGRFVISKLVFAGTLSLSNGTTTPALSQLSMTFEHRCRDSSAPGLSGTLTLIAPATFG